MRRLKTQLASGDRLALSRFWESLTTEHAPILERISNEPEVVLVTFIWRAAPGTTGVKVAGREMARLLDTDLWFVSATMDPGVPIYYSFFPVVAGEADRQLADPLNPHRFIVQETGKTPTPARQIFIEANQRLHQALAARGYDVRYIEVPGARHDPIHWRSQLTDGLIYLAGKG